MFYNDIFMFDFFSLIGKLLILLTTIIVLVIYKERHNAGIFTPWEIPIIISFGTSFNLLLVTTFDLLFFTLAIEGLTICLYFLSAIEHKKSSSHESAVKYFTLSVISSGIIWFSIFIIYFTITQSLGFTTIYYLLSNDSFENLLSSWILPLTGLSTGLFFKLGAFPNHFWIKTTYEGLTAPILVYFALPVKVGIMVFFFRTILYLFTKFSMVWATVLNFAGLGSLIMGCFIAYKASTINQFVGGSSINNLGLILIGLSTQSALGTQGAFLHFFNYIVSTSLFLLLLLTYDLKNGKHNIVLLQDISKIKNTSYYSLLLVIICLSFAGVPPLAGFFGKWYVFQAVVGSSYYISLILIIISSIISSYYYLRIIKYLNFSKKSNSNKVFRSEKAVPLSIKGPVYRYTNSLLMQRVDIYIDQVIYSWAPTWLPESDIRDTDLQLENVRRTYLRYKKNIFETTWSIFYNYSRLLYIIPLIISSYLILYILVFEDVANILQYLQISCISPITFVKDFSL